MKKYNAEQVRKASTLLLQIDFTNNEEVIDIIKFVLRKPIGQRLSLDVQMLKSATREIQFFQNLEPIIVEQCCRRLQYRFVGKSHYVFKEGEEGDNFYIIIQGKCQVLINEDEITILESGESFGERAMENIVRTASVRAIEDSHLAFLAKADYNEILVNVKSQLKKTYFEEFYNLFRDWRFQDVRAFYEKAKLKKYCMNALVYKEGEIPEYIYIIKKGEFKVVKTIKTSTIDLNEAFKGDFEKILSGMSSTKVKTTSEILEARYQKEKFGNMFYLERKKPVTVKYVTVGQMFGEMETLMSYNYRTHSIFSVTDQSEVYRIKVEHFISILEKLPNLKLQLTNIATKKNASFLRQLLQYERNFNDLTEVKKDLEKNINLNFLSLGFKPQLIQQKIKTPTLAKLKSPRALHTDREYIPEIKREFLRRKQYNNTKISYTTQSESFNYNFIGKNK